jgi:hypothetical protein
VRVVLIAVGLLLGSIGAFFLLVVIDGLDMGDNVRWEGAKYAAGFMAAGGGLVVLGNRMRPREPDSRPGHYRRPRVP